MDVLEFMGHAINELLLMGCNNSQEPNGAFDRKPQL